MTDRALYDNSSTSVAGKTAGAVEGFLPQYARHLKKFFDTSAFPLTTVAGTNAVTAALDPVLDASGLVDGMMVTIQWAAANTSTSVTLAINSGTAVPVKKPDGSSLDIGETSATLTSLLIYFSGNWLLLSGTMATEGKIALRDISTITASSSVHAAFVLDTTTYRDHEFAFRHVTPGTDGDILYAQFSTDGGTSWISTASYSWTRKLISSVPGEAFSGGGAATSAVLTNSVGNAAGENGISGKVFLPGPEMVKKTHINAHLSYDDVAGSLLTSIADSRLDSAVAVNAIRFLFSTGLMATGEITHRGYFR